MKLKCDEPLSSFAFEFNLRRYTLVWPKYIRVPIAKKKDAEGNDADGEV